MSRLLRLAVLAALPAIAACTTVGPNYKLPAKAAFNAPKAQGQFLESHFKAVSQAPLPDGWWRLYDDPVLNGLEEKALAANTDLRVAAANLQRAEAAVGEARAAGTPDIAVSAGAQRAQVSAETYLLSEPVPAENLGEVGLQASYQLDLFGRLRRATEAATADADATQAALDLARVSVAAEVAAAYVDACAAGEELASADRIIALQSRSLDAAQRLQAAGRDARGDVTRAKAQLDLVRAAPPPLLARRKADLYRLAALTGEPPAGFPKAVESCSAPPRLGRPIPVGDGAALLRRRPDVRQAERNLAAATARIGVATSDLYPTVTLGAGLGSSGLLGDLGKAVTNWWNLGGLISWTLPGPGAHARIREADASADAALAHFDGVVLNALRETETSLSAYAQELNRNAQLRSAVQDAQEAEQQAATLHRAGRTPYLSELDAERTLATAEASLAGSDGQVAADQVRLFLSLGGGWGASAPAAPPAKG